MSDTREKLIELLIECRGADPAYYGIEAQHIADHLISHGVTFNRDCHWATEQAYKNGFEDGKKIATDNKVGDKLSPAAYKSSATGWIPVSERLPEKFHSVLATRKIGDWFCVDIESIGATGKWSGDVFTDNKVTHWMPLPEPPKE